MYDGENPPAEAQVSIASRVVPSDAAQPDGSRVVRPTGSAAAAHIAAGLGCLTMGLLTWLGAWNPALDRTLSLFEAVGPLSGKSTGAVLIWLLSWAGLEALWRRRAPNFSVVLAVTLGLIALGFAGTFPPFIELTTGWLHP
jgi:hypothetical protein